MNIHAIAVALRALADGLEQPEGERERKADSVPLAMTPPAQTFTSGLPVEDYPPLAALSGPPAQVETALGRCPFHDTAWTIKPAGTSKLGKPYGAFYKCDGKNPDGTWCARKPVKAWVDSHPLSPA